MKTKKNLPFCISFDTQDMPGKIVCVRVQLDKIIIGPKESVNIALREHPLYHHLETYVKNNLGNRDDK